MDSAVGVVNDRHFLRLPAEMPGNLCGQDTVLSQAEGDEGSERSYTHDKGSNLLLEDPKRVSNVRGGSEVMILKFMAFTAWYHLNF